ncbi:hypothetical protein J6590_023051 [Homalodisca vitripennis]|nr:hypothetical protein J6590_023051 [Homalodisca vitripennis]
MLPNWQHSQTPSPQTTWPKRTPNQQSRKLCQPGGGKAKLSTSPKGSWPPVRDRVDNANLAVGVIIPEPLSRFLPSQTVSLSERCQPEGGKAKLSTTSPKGSWPPATDEVDNANLAVGVIIPKALSRFPSSTSKF